VVLGHLLRAAGLDPQMVAEALGRIKVYEVMAERTLTVTPETGLREAALLMIENKIVVCRWSAIPATWSALLRRATSSERSWACLVLASPRGHSRLTY